MGWVYRAQALAVNGADALLAGGTVFAGL